MQGSGLAGLDVAPGAFLRPDDILRHPGFAGARDAYIDTLLAIYEFRPPMIELMLDGGRILVYGIVMALWGGYREDDPGTTPTLGRLKETVGWFSVASGRQIDLIVARFAQARHLQVLPARHDRRLRVLLPSPALIEHDRAFIRAHYTALAALYGREAYILPLAGDLAFLKAMRAAWTATLRSMAQDIILSNRPLLRFYGASSGMLMLMKLVRLAGRPDTGGPHAAAPEGIAVDYTDFGRRFGVSRTHVRTLFRAVAAEGGLTVDPAGRLWLHADLVAALDRNIAGRLSLLDRSHAAAMARLAGRRAEGGA